MRKTGLGLRLSLLILAAIPLACSDSPQSSPQGSGGASGSASGGSSGNGGSAGNPATGGSATGGSVGSGGSAGGASGASGGTSGRGGATGVGGSQPGGAGGSQPGGAGGTEPGGAGGTGTGGSKPGGAGGTSPGGAGGTPPGDGSAGGTSGTTDDGGSDDATADATPASSCTDKTTGGDETDVDCGGGTCPKCGAGKVCKQDTDCKSGSCASGKCADPFAATGTITSSTDNRIWTLTMGTMVLEVQTGGGKIVTYSLDGTNFLVVNDASTGSVFWIAPQAEWNANGWPPPSEMDDNTAYTPTSKNNVLTMAGPAGTDGLSISKRFWGNAERQTVTMEYTIKNGSNADVKKAPWEITRVYPGGLTFFPTAETPVQMPGTCKCFLAVPFTTSAGVAWFKYQKADFTQDIKGGADGLEGWAAHVNCGTGLEKACATGSKSMVLIKEWDDSTVMAPDEKEVEIYANAGHNYVEFEQQGNYQTIPAGGTVVWTMHWMLRYLPTNISAKPDNADLVTWVRGQLL